SSLAWSTTSTTCAVLGWSRSSRSRAARKSCSWPTCSADSASPGRVVTYRGRGGDDAVRVLVVEDDSKVRDLLRRGLEQQSFAVAVAADGAEALWQARESSFDAIVLDVILPDADGFAVCDELRVSGSWAPILMLTALDDVQDRVRGL